MHLIDRKYMCSLYFTPVPHIKQLCTFKKKYMNFLIKKSHTGENCSIIKKSFYISMGLFNLYKHFVDLFMVSIFLLLQLWGLLAGTVLLLLYTFLFTKLPWTLQYPLWKVDTNTIKGIKGSFNMDPSIRVWLWRCDFISVSLLYNLIDTMYYCS